MYKVGMYEYKSKEDYENMVLGILLLFLAAMLLIYLYRTEMNQILFGATFTLCFLMIIHLGLRWLASRSYIQNYPLNHI